MKIKSLVTFIICIFLSSSCIGQTAYSQRWINIWKADPSKRVGIWPHIYQCLTVAQVKDIKFRWGYNYIFTGALTTPETMKKYISAGYDKQHIIVHVNNENIPTQSDFQGVFAYMVDEPIAAGTLSIDQLVTLRENINDYSSTSKLMITEYDEDGYSFLDTGGDPVRDLMNIDAININEIACDAYSNDCIWENCWESEWRDFHDQFSDRFKSAWINLGENYTEFDAMLNHAKNAPQSLIGVYLFCAGPGLNENGYPRSSLKKWWFEPYMQDFSRYAQKHNYGLPVSKSHQEVREEIQTVDIKYKMDIYDPYYGIPIPTWITEKADILLYRWNVGPARDADNYDNRSYTLDLNEIHQNDPAKGNRVNTNEGFYDYYALNTITATNYVVPSNDSSKFCASEIILKPGFQACHGSYFIAFIGDRPHQPLVLPSLIPLDKDHIPEKKEVIPSDFVLMQNYPNPFNPSTAIKYAIPKTQHVSLRVYNLLGKEIAVLVDGVKNPGFYHATFDGNNLPSGVYIYQIKTEEFTKSQKMILIK